MYSVVNYPEEKVCEVISTSWLTDENNKSFYPEYKGTRFWKAVTNSEKPKLYWKTYLCRVLYQTNDLTKAKSKRDKYEYLDTDEIQTGSEATGNQINKRKRFPNKRYANSISSPELSSDGSLSDNDYVKDYKKINRNQSYVSKDKICSKKNKSLPDPEYSTDYLSANNNIQSVDKEISLPSSALQTAAKVTTESQLETVTGQSTKLVSYISRIFEDIKYDISNIKKDIKYIKTKLPSDSVIDEKLPDETETLIPALSLKDLSNFNQLLKQKFVFTLYENHFRRLGGFSQADHTRKILKRIIHNQLAQKLNWAGRGDKTSFQTFDTVCQLVLKTANVNNKEGSYEIIEETIKSWLRYALDRDGGRNKRKKNINNNHQSNDDFYSENENMS